MGDKETTPVGHHRLQVYICKERHGSGPWVDCRNSSKPGVSGAKAGAHADKVKDDAPPLEFFQSVLEYEEDAIDLAKRIAGSVAYRKYDFLRDLAKKNVVNQFTGMVINKKARIAYQYLGKAGDRIGHAASFLAVAQELVNSYSSVSKTLSSSDDNTTKAAKLSFEVSAIGLRLLGKIGTGAIGTGSLLLRADRYLSPICWISSCQSVDDLADRLDRFQAKANAAIDTVYTGENIYKLVTHVVSLTQ
jgi:hypothetical protein